MRISSLEQNGLLVSYLVALIDACLPIASSCHFNVDRILNALVQRNPRSYNLQVDCLPMFVNDQWRQAPSTQDTPPPQPGVSARGSSSTLPAVSDLDSDLYHQELHYISGACPKFRSSALAQAAPSDNMFCGAYIADGNQLCRRVNTLQSLLEVNREMANVEITGPCSQPYVTVHLRTLVSLDTTHSYHHVPATHVSFASGESGRM